MEKETNISQSNLTEFEWDDPSDTWFGTNPEPDVYQQQQKVIDDIKKEDEEKTEEIVDEPTTKKTETPAKAAGEEIDDKEVEFFNEDDDTTKEDNEDDKEVSSYFSVLSELKDEFISEFELDENEPISKDTFKKILDAELEARIDEENTDLVEALGEDGKQIFKYLKNGGTIKQYLQLNRQIDIVPSYDIESERGQEMALRHYYAQYEDLEPEDIDDKIEWHKEKGHLTKYAQKYFQTMTENEKEAREEIIKQQEKAMSEMIENRKKFIGNVQNVVDKGIEVGDFKITKKDKNLIEYINKGTVKIGPNKYIPELNAKLSEILNDPEKVLILAKIIKNDFDISDVVRNAITTNTKAKKTQIEKGKSGNSVTPSSINTHKKKRSIVDYF